MMEKNRPKQGQNLKKSTIWKLKIWKFIRRNFIRRNFLLVMYSGHNEQNIATGFGV